MKRDENGTSPSSQIEEESLSKRNRLSTPNHDDSNSSRITISELYALVKEESSDKLLSRSEQNKII